MPLDDFLIPGESIKFSSRTIIEFGGKPYKVFVTDKRLLLYARRGLMLKSDDIIGEKLDNLHGIKYSESGRLFKSATISIQGAMKFDLIGTKSEIKPLFHSLQSILNRNK
jgi:hypothetical protein